MTTTALRIATIHCVAWRQGVACSILALRSRTAPVSRAAGTHQPLSFMQSAHDTGFAIPRTLLRCFGQTVLQGSARTGICVLFALALCDLRLACAAIMGAMAAHVCALILHYDSDIMRDGVYGFNGVLCALAAAASIDDAYTALAVALLSAIAATSLCKPALRWLGDRNLAMYSSPCLVATWGWMLIEQIAQSCAAGSRADLGPLYERVAQMRFPLATFSNAAFNAPLPGPLDGFLSAMAQTVFASGLVPGLLILAGIAMASRRAALRALGGAAIATAVARLCGAPHSSSVAGVSGFNGALAALALADRNAVTGASAAALSALLQQVCIHAGWPAMSAPFVVATWCVRMSMRVLARTRLFVQ